MNNVDAAMYIERLLNFAEKNKMIEKIDRIPCKNALLDLLEIEEPFEGKADEKVPESPNEILRNLLDFAVMQGIIKDDTVTMRDLMDARIMGILMPRQSEVVKNFYNIEKEQGIENATDYFYRLSKASNYIRVDRTEKNLYWLAPTEYGSLEITINLSKPEKDPRDIAAARSKAQSNYPKCLLCLENVGFAGHVNHPARQNHRVIPIEVSNENWYLQYSPYVYYNEHCILFYENHVPMKISEKTFGRLFDFIDRFPHYFIGSNADLPIVGGSILTHEHFQGGRHIFPMEEAPVEAYFYNKAYPEVKAGIVKWPLSVIRLSSKDKASLINLSIDLLKLWREYSDRELDILAFTEDEEKKINHNTITPIARMNKRGEYEIDLVLRNNRTTEEYPDGIFHPHRELHHIKKENIGLIEVMGLAVLPARLSRELKEIEKFLTGETVFCRNQYDEKHELYKHLEWINYLLERYGNNLDEKKAEKCIREEVGSKFLRVLLDAGVFKRDTKGYLGFEKFMKNAGFIKKGSQGEVKIQN